MLRSLTIQRWRVLAGCLFAHSRRAIQAVPLMSTRQRSTSTVALGTCHLQVLGVGSSEVFPSVTLFTDSQRYLFNCSENTQRVCSEHKVRLGKLQNVFFTRLKWQNVGGLPGLAMTLRDMGTPLLHLHGPRRLDSFVEALGSVLSKENVKLDVCREMKGLPPLPTYCDENITVVSVELHNGSDNSEVEGSELARSSCSSSGGSSTDEEETGKEFKVASKPKAKRMKRSSTPDDVTMAFVCKLADMPGKFNPSKAKELGLPPGPAYSKLVQGESVLTPEGKTVHSSDVLGPGRMGASFVILECPHVGFVESVVTHPLLQPGMTLQCPNPALIVHIAPQEVVQNERYCQWMNDFGKGTTHLLLHETLCQPEVTFRASMKLQCPLHLLCPDLYHLPYACSEGAGTSQVLDMLHPSHSGIVGKPFLKYHFLPERKAGVDDGDVLKPMREVLSDQLKEIRSNHQLTTILTDKGNEKLLTGGDKVLTGGLSPGRSPVDVSNVTVTFLGTGSSLPSKYRNVSGILLRSPLNGSILLDPGEGTMTQIYRCFGKEGGDQIIRQLKCIFVSHIHGDHHLGLISALLKHAELLGTAVTEGNKLLTIGPGILGSWLRKYSKCQLTLFDFVTCSELTQLGSLASDAIKDRIGMELRTVPVLHCRAAYGVVLQYPGAEKVVYSGDTRPCPELINAGQGADLLIHEATFEDELVQDAIERRHCTVSEALEVAGKMNAHFTLLTHFSQRYPKVSPALLNSECARQKTGIAFDCFSVSVKEAHRLPSLFSVLRDVFALVLDADDISGVSNSWFW